ncbi:MAG: hypothetical protein WDZ35_02150 [Crocinitomicaceae bacterium]
MKKQKHLLQQFSKSEKPEVPHGFFDHFPDELTATISENEGKLHTFQKTEKPEIPDGFFTAFSQKMNDLPLPVEKKANVIRLKIAGFVSAVAACLLLGFFLMPEPETEVIAHNQTEKEDTEESVDADYYLAILEEDDLVNFILENKDISVKTEEVTDNQEEIYDFLKDDLEELYIENL